MSAIKLNDRSPKKPLTHLKGRKWTKASSLNAETEQLSTSLSPSAPSSSKSQSQSPEPNCAICLGKIEDKSFTDRCFHSFCRTCLFEWSKVKAECPVCRQAFEKIIFNIRSMDDYDEHIVETQRFPHSSPFMTWANIDGVSRFRYPTTLTPLRRRMLDFERRLFDMHEFTRRFHQIGYLTAESRRTRLTPNEWSHNGNGAYHHHRIDSVPMNPMFDFSAEIFPPPPGTTAHRRYIYDSDLWVLPNGDGNVSRTREVGHRFFAANAACTHRLIPWLNREFNVMIQNSSEVAILIPRIMDALLKYDITSRDFKRIIAPYTLNRTDHFVHEFYNFARSPYDMEHYTRIAVYVPRHRATIIQSEPIPALGMRIEPYDSDSSSSSSDSSVRILSPNHDITIFSPPRVSRPMRYTPHLRQYYGNSMNDQRIDNQRASSAPTPASPASDVSSQEIRGFITQSSVSNDSPVDLRISVNSGPLSPNLPTPLPQGDLPDVNFGAINVVDDLDNPLPGPSGINLRSDIGNRPTAQTRWSDSDTDIDVGQELEAALARFERAENHKIRYDRARADDSDNNNIPKIEYDNNDIANDSDSSSVLIVGYVKPLRDRTPEVIDLIDNDSDDGSRAKVMLNDDHDKIKSVKKEKRDKHRKGKHHHSLIDDDDNHHDKRQKYKSHHKLKRYSKDKDIKDKGKGKDKHKKKYKGHRHVSYKYNTNKYNDTSSSSTDSSSDDDKGWHKISRWRKYRKYSHKRPYLHCKYRYNNIPSKIGEGQSSSSSGNAYPDDRRHFNNNSTVGRDLLLNSSAVNHSPVDNSVSNIRSSSIGSSSGSGPSLGSVIGYHNLQCLSPIINNNTIDDDDNTFNNDK